MGIDSLAAYRQQAGLNSLASPTRGGTGWAQSIREWLKPDPNSEYGSILPAASSTQYSNPTTLDAQGRAIHGMEVPYQERRLAMPSIGSETIGNLVNYADAPRAAAMGEFDPNTPENIEMLARGAFDAGAGGMLFNKAPAGSLRSGAIRTAADDVSVARKIYRGTNSSGESISGGISEGSFFVTPDESVARLYGDTIEEMAFKPNARILVEGTPEFASVTGRRRGPLLRTMRQGENLKSAADDAARLAQESGYDAVEFNSMKDMGIAVFNEDALVRSDLFSGPNKSLSAPLSPAEQQAQSIIDLLKGGNAASVTDDMLAAADQKYLFDNYDLPMDTASRMGRAKEMGFWDDINYRGDRADLESFNTGQNAREGIGVTTSTSPNVAATYMTTETPAMYPVRGRVRDPLVLDAEGRNWFGVPPDAKTYDGALNDVLDTTAYLDEDNLFDFNIGDEAFAKTDDVSRAAQEAGYDEVRFNNIVDRGGAGKWHTSPANDPHTTIMTADPSNIRSQFARFDPRLSHLSNLSASGMSPTAAAFGAMSPVEQIQEYLNGIRKRPIGGGGK